MGFHVILIDHIQSQLITETVQGAVIRIVAGADGIDIVPFHQDQIPADLIFRHGTPGLGAEIMPVRSLEHNTDPVDQDHTVFDPDFAERVLKAFRKAGIDESRILTEAAIYADKVAVDEETVRLRSHIAQLRDMLQSEQPTGRKLDFLIQEVNRECNTIGSKCNDLTITQDVVNMKAEVEKIREQVQNIE